VQKAAPLFLGITEVTVPVPGGQNDSVDTKSPVPIPVPLKVIHLGRYAYGRVYDEAGLGVYSQITDEPHKPPIGSRDFQFIIGVYNKVLTSGEWPIVGDDPFGENEDPWPPPRCMIDSISGKYSIYHHGKTTPASAEECQDLEVTAVWDRDHIIDRILHGNESKYLKSLRRK